MAVITPPVLWAQRSSADDASKNVIYLTIEIYDAINIKLDLTATELKLSADSKDDSNKYALDIQFFDEIVPEDSHKNTESGQRIFMILRKKEKKAEYWPRLTKQKLKYHYIKTDFDRWVDEDEQDEQVEENDDMSNMMNMGGGGGGAPGGLDFSQLMQGMGGGAGGDGNFDISKLASQIGQAGGDIPGNEDEGEDDDEGTAEEEK